MQNIILGSSSPIRQQLFARLQLPFIIVSPDIDETPHADEAATDLVKRLAQAKLEKIKQDYPNSIIICCDQVITVNNVIFGKPLNHDNAVQQLLACSNNVALSLTCLAVYDPQHQSIDTETVPYEVYFRSLTLEQIESYLQKDQPYQCAGSIQAESLGPALFEKMAGDDPTALLGLPMITTVKLLEKAGVNIL